ncbi:hypothetical protein G5V57_17890 [Nordella sp. HKS 07]|uniref:hypothetical protein n=1 Tax=Nordella sp. HKS 07 TaxID=2712222 RepID=UPI0013E1149F|nr:hypothetical protein [Nordella sp. HKS 07]QIG49424.1 hypothetical protein G5V57_17890 [Nordella sp. HKS 07]
MKADGKEVATAKVANIIPLIVTVDETLEHRTEKCEAVFGESDAQIEELERRTDST